MTCTPSARHRSKAVYGPSHQIQAPLRSSDGSTLLTDKEAILQRWSEHFESLFSDHRSVQESLLAKVAYKAACSTLQAELRTMQNDWWTGLAERTQRYADMVMCAFYEAMKAIYGPSHQIQAPLHSSDGSTLLTGKETILQRWSEHFEGLFSDQLTVQESSLAKIPQMDVKLELDDLPSLEEIRKATMQLKVGKSPGIDGIPAEVYQHGGETLLDKLQDLFTNCFEKGTLPQELRNAVIVSTYKNKFFFFLNRLFKLSKHHSALHCRQNHGFRLTEWTHSDDSTKRKLVGSGPTEIP